MTTTTATIPFHLIEDSTQKAISRLLTGIDGEWIRNEFHGYDCVVADGSVRLHGDSVYSEEGLSLTVFNRMLVPHYSVRFDATTPKAVIVAAIKAAF